MILLSPSKLVVPGSVNIQLTKLSPLVGPVWFVTARDSPAPRSIISTWHIPLQPQLLPTLR